MRDFILTLVALLFLTALSLVPTYIPRSAPHPTATPVPVASPSLTGRTWGLAASGRAEPAHGKTRLQRAGLSVSTFDTPPAAEASSREGSIADPLIGGRATWYPASGMIAAAGPALRHYLGKHWRGMLVEVCGSGRCVVVRASDWCLCTGNGGRLIDLSDDAFAQLAPLSRGVIAVSITRAVRVPAPPATDTAP